jgi:hypothetical protein
VLCSIVVVQIEQEEEAKRKEEEAKRKQQADREEQIRAATLILQNEPQQALHDLLATIADDDEAAFSEVLGRMQPAGGYDVWMDSRNTQLVAVPPLHRCVSKGSTNLVKQCVAKAHGSTAQIRTAKHPPLLLLLLLLLPCD